MSDALLGWLLLPAGVVLDTLGAVQTRSLVRGRALKSGDALALKQAGVSLFIHSNEIANPRGLKA